MVWLLHSGMALAELADEDLEKVAQEIKEARPTAVNLFWAVDRILEAKSAGKSALDEAILMFDEDIQTNKTLGKYGSQVIEDGDTILTHCNAGALACVDYGTALGVIRAAVEDNKKFPWSVMRPGLYVRVRV